MIQEDAGFVNAKPGTFRRVCYRCHKAAIVCVCDGVERVLNRTGIVILQHPRERFHPIGTTDSGFDFRTEWMESDVSLCPPNKCSNERTIPRSFETRVVRSVSIVV